jgi:hypothetical protein
MNDPEHLFQRAFHEALLRPADAARLRLPGIGEAAAFAVYRNTVMKGCVDALQANFPTVDRLVGADWFRAAAARYVTTAPPCDGRLLAYGDGFPEFLARMLPPGLAYVAEVAPFDAAWRACHAAADAPPLDPCAVARLAPEALAATVLPLHPAARWIWCDTAPAFALWQRHRPPGEAAGPEIAWQGDGGLLTRPGDSVQCRPLDAATHGFLQACASGCTLGQAAEYTWQHHPDADLSALLQQLLLAGVFVDHLEET